jgi:uncharacterized protein with HEPN domain
MRDELKKYLEDISTAVNHILQFTSGINGVKDFSSSLIIKRAVERELEIIGEALSQAIKMDNALPITNARKIINTRNKIIHGYDDVDDAVLWAIIIKHLPILNTEIKGLLNKSQ